jgi:hypothetical protein
MLNTDFNLKQRNSINSMFYEFLVARHLVKRSCESNYFIEDELRRMTKTYEVDALLVCIKETTFFEYSSDLENTMEGEIYLRVLYDNVIQKESYIMFEICLKFEKFKESLKNLSTRIQRISYVLKRPIYIIFIVDGSFSELTFKERFEIKRQLYDSYIGGAMIYHLGLSWILNRYIGIDSVTFKVVSDTFAKHRMNEALLVSISTEVDLLSRYVDINETDSLLEKLNKVRIFIQNTIKRHDEDVSSILGNYLI